MMIFVTFQVCIRESGNKTLHRNWTLQRNAEADNTLEPTSWRSLLDSKKRVTYGYSQSYSQCSYRFNSLFDSVCIGKATARIHGDNQTIKHIGIYGQ